MGDEHSFNNYKKAKIIVKELDQVLKVIKLSIKGLTPYRKYNSLQETILSLQDSESILEIHFSHWEQVLKNKGKTLDEKS